MEVAAEVAERLHSGVETRVFALLRAARPHPVGRERDALETFCHRSPHDVGKCFCHRQHAASLWRRQSCLRSVAESGGDAFLAAVVESHHTAVAERQLYLTLALLTCYLASHGAVYLVGEPVLTCHCFEL